MNVFKKNSLLCLLPRRPFGTSGHLALVVLTWCLFAAPLAAGGRLLAPAAPERERVARQASDAALGQRLAAISQCSVSYAWQKAPDITEKALIILEKNNSQLNRFVLDNGTICLVKEDHSAPVVSIQIWVGTGSIHEQDYLGAGLSHAIEHMIFKGTGKRAPGDIAREINDAGGKINAYTGSDRTVFHTDLPAEKWRIGLSVLADAVMHASFPVEEWKKEKQVILREMAMGRDDPGRVLDKLLWRTAYVVHPYKFPVIGYEDIFKNITRNELAAFFHRNYVPDNMIVVIVGHIEAEEVEAEIRKVFADFPRKARAPVVLPREPAQLTQRFARQTGSYKVSRLQWAYHTVVLSHPDTPALDLLAEITGHGRSSKLVREIKEKQKLVHSIDAWSYTPKEPGIFGITATFDPQKEDEVVAAIQKEIGSWLTARFSRKEISKARRMILSSELSDLQTTKGQATSYATGEFYASAPRYSETYLKQLAEITPKHLQAIARKYLQSKNKTLVILSPSPHKKDKPLEVADIHKPEIEKIVLSSGVPLLVREDHRLPFVYFCVALGGGLLSENDSNNGITRLMSELMVRGTKARSSDEIARTVEEQGGTLIPFSGHNSFGLQAKCLSPDTEIFMEIVSDCLLNASFPADEIAKQKLVQLAEIDQQHERPFFLAQEALRHILFPSHPYRCIPLGTKEAVEKIERADLLAHFKKHVVSGNIVLSVFGNITPSAAKNLAVRYLKKIPHEPAPEWRHGEEESQLPARTKQRVPKEQSILLAGFPGVAITDPRCDALTVLKTIMSGLSSDFGIAIREKRGLAYYVGAYQQVGIEPGMFVFYAGTREDAVEEVESLFDEEIGRIVTGGIREEELQRARNKIIADYETMLQDNSSLAMNCALNELYGLGHSYIFTTKQRFDTMALEDICRAAQSILSANKMAISLVLPE